MIFRMSSISISRIIPMTIPIALVAPDGPRRLERLTLSLALKRKPLPGPLRSPVGEKLKECDWKILIMAPPPNPGACLHAPNHEMTRSLAFLRPKRKKKVLPKYLTGQLTPCKAGRGRREMRVLPLMGRKASGITPVAAVEIPKMGNLAQKKDGSGYRVLRSNRN